MKKLTIIFLAFYALCGAILNLMPGLLTSNQIIFESVATILGSLFTSWVILGSYKLTKYTVIKLN